MKKLTLVWASALAIAMVIAGAGVIPMVGIVKAAIPVPHNNWGHPYDESGITMDVPELITSWIDGVEYGRNDTFLFGGEVWYDIDTVGNWVTAPGDPNSPWVKEGGDLGEPIMFAWGDMTNIKLDPDSNNVLDYGIFEEYDLWFTTAVNQTNINLSALADQPPMFPKISQIIPEPSDGLPDYLLIYTEDPFFDMSDFYLQKNDGALNGPTQPLTGVSNSTAYFYANLTDPAMDLQGCGDEIKLVWTNPGPAFGGMDIVVDRVEWNATSAGCHYTEPDNTIMTDAVAPTGGNATHRTGSFPVYADDTNDNAVDFVTDKPWPRPVPGAPALGWITPAGGEDWTGGMDHMISFSLTDSLYPNNLIDLWVNYSINDGTPGTWNPATTERDPQPFPGNGSAVIPESMLWSVPSVDTLGLHAVLQVCARNLDLKYSCASSQPFEIDSTPPTVQATDPQNSNTSVPINTDINIWFDEMMNTGSVVYTIEPGVTGLVDVWSTNDHLMISHDDFAQGTTYWVNVTDGCDDSVTGNCMTGPHSFMFTTYLVTIPGIDITAPMGGEIWSGGSNHDIVFWTWHNGTNGLTDTWVYLEYSCNATVHSIVDAQGDNTAVWGTGPPFTYTWTVAMETAGDCFVIGRIVDSDDGLETSDTGDIPTIDSIRPTVTGTNPIVGQTDVALDTAVVVTFSEAMNTAATEAAFSMLDTPTSTAVPGGFGWTIGDTVLTFTPTDPLAGGTEYCVTITTAATDISDPGNGLAAEETFCFTTLISNTPPVVTVTVPATGARWAGGSSQLLQWTLEDDGGVENLTVDVSYIYNSQATAIVTGLTGGPLNYTWTVACPVASGDATGVTIFVEATDASSLSGNGTSGAFTIDCSSPTGTIAWTGEEKEGKTLTFRVDNPSETIASYSWDFGDGTSGISGATPTHVYDKGDTYTVSCTLTDAAGNTNTISAQIEIEKKAAPTGFLDQYWWVILIIIIVVILVLILLLARRKKPEEEEGAPLEEEEEYEEETPEEEMEYEEEEVVEEEPGYEEEAAPAAAAGGEEAPAGETKECPSCGTVVPADATECFLCGATL